MSDRSSFARNFFVLTTTTLLIITVVKSSLALSLGLVGALSIVRFRSAIKDPEELTFLFLAIAVGLGLGANQRLVVGIGFVFIVAVFVGRHLLFRPSGLDAYHLVVNVSSTVDIDSIVKLVGEHASRNMLKRLDDGDRMELAFAVSFKGTAEIAALRTGIKKLDSTAKTTFLDLEGLIR